MKFIETKWLTGIIEVKSGLHIGSFSFKGVDKAIVVDANAKPYIPGSSFKGKLRALAEQKIGVKTRLTDSNWLSVTQDLSEEEKKFAELLIKGFGSVQKATIKIGDNEQIVGPSRFIFRDCPLNRGYQGPVIEIKYENSISRASMHSVAREIERVAKGAQFEYCIGVKIYEGDDFDEYQEFLQGLFSLLESDGLGAFVSRGYGEVKFVAVNG